MEGKFTKHNYEELFSGTKWSLPTDMYVEKAATIKVAQMLNKAGWDEEEAGKISALFSEGLINAMAHGNLGVFKPEGGNSNLFKVAVAKQETISPEMKVEVTVEISKEKAYFKIIDKGAGFKPELVPDPTLPENIFKDSGRGIHFMRNYFDQFEIKSSEAGTEVTMVKERKA